MRPLNATLLAPARPPLRVRVPALTQRKIRPTFLRRWTTILTFAARDREKRSTLPAGARAAVIAVARAETRNVGGVKRIPLTTGRAQRPARRRAISALMADGKSV